jgi:hypothetical protein
MDMQFSMNGMGLAKPLYISLGRRPAASVSALNINSKGAD